MHLCHSGRKPLPAFAALLVLLVSGRLPAERQGFQVDVGTAFLHGPVEGRVQTPAGGHEGSTSPGRPTFDELGIDDGSASDFWANLSWGPHTLYGGARLMRLSAGATLDETLISQNLVLAAGLPVEAYAKLDWYRVGYGYTFDWTWGDRMIELRPSIGASILDFHYTLSSPDLEDVDRSYTKVGVQAGLGVTCPLTKRLSLSGQVLAPLPLSHAPEIFSAQVALKYRFLERKNLSISGSFGVDYDRISYTDGQDVPNDILAEIGPMPMLGLEIRF